MKQMNCPLNGLRNIQEFAHGGEVVDQPDPNRCSDAEAGSRVAHAMKVGVASSCASSSPPMLTPVA